MLLKLDGRYPELFNPNTRLCWLERRPSWGVVTADPSTENRIQGWFGESPDDTVWFSVFSDGVDFRLQNRLKCELTVHHVFSLIQQVYWDFRYRSWAMSAMSRMTGNPDWNDDTPEAVEHLRDVPDIAPVNPPTILKLN